MCNFNSIIKLRENGCGGVNGEEITYTASQQEAATFTTGASKLTLTGKPADGTTNPNASAEFKVTTDEGSGTIILNGLLAGDYIAHEVGATGNFSDYYVAKVSATNPITVSSAQTATVDVENIRRWIDISGIVWLDNIDTMKKSEKNGLYMNNDTEQDLLLEGIQVRLVHSVNSAKNMEATTNKDGYYEFKKVLIDDIPYYDVVFTYNGMSYEPVKVTMGVANGNKTAETTQKIETKEEIAKDRTTFNNNYATITKGKSNAHNLTYLTSDYKSELSYREDKNTGKYNYGNDKNQEGRGPVNSIDNQYMIEASTLYGYGGHISKEIADKAEEAKNLIKTTGRLKVENINLGLQTREQPDIALVKDLYRIKVGINGQTHIYNYGDRFNDKLYAQEGNESIYNMNPQVKFGSKYGSMSYTRALYASDIKYTENKPLEVYVTYRIGIKNISNQLKIVINEIVDYTDVKYKFIEENGNITSIGRNIDEEGNITGARLEVNEESSGNSEYQKIRIQTNLEIAKQTEEYIYIQLQVEPDRIVDILENDDGGVKLDNIAEISSYSTKDTNGKPYAGIDIDSQPDNTELTNPKTYEDDTDKAPGLKLVLQEQRKVSGQVFEDVTNGDFKLGKIRQGDGKLTLEDKGIEDVTVKLVNAQTGKTAQVYNGRTWVEATTQTNNNGEYTIEGFIPDNYKVVYTWGDSHYKVQDYKSTIVDKASYNAKDGNLEWYKDEFKQTYPNFEWDQAENAEIRASDAVDDYETRRHIDEQTSMITNSNKLAINEYSGEGEIEKAEGNKEQLITTMDSTTPNFKVGIEYFETGSNAREEYQLNDDGEVVMNGIYAVKQKGKENYLTSIDFGIVERARQVLELNKTVKSAKITLANGTVLVNAKVNENGKLEDTVKHAVYIPDSVGANGQIKIEVDNEIIQGAKLEIEYALKVKNISELDYSTKEYYLYGKENGENNIVTLSAKQVIDYLDDSIVINEENNEIEEIIQDNSKKNQLINDGLLNDTEEMKALLNSTDRVLIIDGLDEKLKPTGESTQSDITIKSYKLLSNISNTEEMAFGNDAEIIKVEKSGGSSLITTPGNYVPSSTSSEYDDDSAETVSIVPPTGLSINYIGYTLLAISSLGILTAGIIFIKKFTLRKE